MGLERYDRQIRIPQLGKEGQQRLARARVLVVGAGGLGSPAALYLVAAGVGTLGLVDDDVVALSNLNRQILHRTADLGVAKVQSGARALGQLNPAVKLQLYQERLDLERAAELSAKYDLVVDASDSFVSKYVMNDAAVRAKTPLVHAGVEGMVGQVALLARPGGPCLRCVFPEPAPDTTEPRAILGATAGVVGSIEAAEAIMQLVGLRKADEHQLLAVNLLDWQFHTMTIQADPACPACAEGPSA